MEKLEAFYKTHKTLATVLGVILLPITLLLIALKIYMYFQVSKAHEEVENAKKEDQQLRSEEDQLKKESNAAVSEADKAAQRIEDRHDEPADMDWHKKRND